MELLFESDLVVAIVTAGSSGRDLKPSTIILIKHVKQHVLEEFYKEGRHNTQSTEHLGVGSMQDLHTYQISRLECRCL